MHYLGNVYYSRASGFAILVQVAPNQVCLVCLASGNRWRNPVPVADPQKITVLEWDLVTNKNEFTFCGVLASQSFEDLLIQAQDYLKNVK